MIYERFPTMFKYYILDVGNFKDFVSLVSASPFLTKDDG
jgi:hypothetical protein